jgi:hypothetical protein
MSETYRKNITYLHTDGMDLAGKTTGTKKFIEKTKTHWEIRRNSISQNNPIYLLADSLRKEDAYDAEILGNLFTVALTADIHSFKYPEVNTIQDSTIILRSLAYHTVRGTPRITEVLRDCLGNHPTFDLSFVFTASIEARLKRLQMRIDQNPEEVAPDDLMVKNNPEKFLAMEACLIDLARQNFHSVIIDTSSLTPDVVVGIINQEYLKHVNK